REAIDSLVKHMEDFQNDFVIIMAGYPYEMDYFLRLNPGLKSRFPFIIDFPDYSVEELINIAKIMAYEREYILSKSANLLLKNHLIEKLSFIDYNFSNARYIRNTIQRAISTQAMRLVGMNHLLTDDLMLLTREDFSFIDE